MKSYEEYVETASDRTPFSNGSEWLEWQFNRCDGLGEPGRECANDLNDDCPLILLIFAEEKTPAEWTGDHARYDCSEYTPKEEA